MRALVVLVVLAGIAGGLWFWFAAEDRPPPPAETVETPAMPEGSAPEPHDELPPAAHGHVEPVVETPVDAGRLLAEGKRLLGTDEARGIALLTQAAAADPQGTAGRDAAQALLPVAARKGLARKELTCRWRLGQMDESAWKRLEDLNAPLFSHDRASKDPATSYHVVEPGDSLEKIGKRYGTTVGLIQRLNALPANDPTIHPGDRLKILSVRGKIAIEVRKSECAAYLLYDGDILRKYRVGIGSGDLTPEGTFRIANRLPNPDWWKDGKRIPFGDPENILGTRWLGFERPYQKYAVHGTAMPESIGKKVSNGCIRMLNKDVEEVYDFTPPGAVVVILP